MIDIYVNQGKLEFAKNLFSDIPNINKIIEANSQYYMLKSKYLAALYFDAMLRVDHIDEGLLCDVPQVLRKNLQNIKKTCAAYGLESGAILYSIHYARCEKDGLNCYTSYNRYHAFHVTDFRTSVPLINDYEKNFKSLRLSDYITLNYGWDKSNGVIRPAAKAWPLEYFSSLARMIKERFPKISVIQTGTKDAEKIEHCDQYIFGESIETIKYVLKNSLLHIDIEGGLVHIATQLGTKCIALFGPTPVKYYGYDVNINIVSEKCKNCYWLVGDCISCYRGMEKPECMYSISPSMVMDNVEEVLNKRFGK
ncbi:MAG: glycosyltransferase family 9 protein [Selenomonadaceae bacterium]|nr:glycosyltransferase family 9 protein [Selenomonadaceae bacterium]